jgi:hypothetical protein
VLGPSLVAEAAQQVAEKTAAEAKQEADKYKAEAQQATKALAEERERKGKREWSRYNYKGSQRDVANSQAPLFVWEVWFG